MISRILPRVLLTGLLLLSSSAALAAKEELVSLNFVNADIQEVIRAISQISKKNFLVDPRVKGTINIVSATPVSPALGYDILLSALRMQGYAAVESAGVTKIMPEADAKMHVDTLAYGRGDKLVTRVFILRSESASQLVNVIRPMISPNNTVVAYPSSNALVVTDYASSIKRIEKIIASIDQQSSLDLPTIIPIKHTSAIDLARTINTLIPEGTTQQPGGDDNQRFVLLADGRTNSLLLRTDNRSRITFVKTLVEQLDRSTDQPGNVHVVALKNAEAGQLAQTLRAVLSGDTSAIPGNDAQRKVAPGAPATAGTPSGGGMVQAELASNSLIITAPESVYQNLRAVIERLDVRRPQVFVEALIVELTADKAAEFGVQWQHLTGINKPGANVIGGTNFGTGGNNIIGASSNIGTVGQGLNIGIVKGQTTLPGIGTVLNLGMLARALETDNNANVLSAPNLMTLDNEEAKIVVGQNVPFITGQYAQTGSTTTATPFQTIERKDVGLTLRIKPQIMQGGTVKLQIYQEVSSVVASAASTAGVVTNKRSIESNILVDENQIVVLGGLIQDQVNEVQSKTPLLGDIPLLGSLFRYQTRQRSKTNLMVFIRPLIMYQKDAAQHLTRERYEQMRQQREDERMPFHLFMPSDDTAPLPDLPPDAKPVSPAQPESQPAAGVENTEATPASTPAASAVESAPAMEPGTQP